MSVLTRLFILFLLIVGDYHCPIAAAVAAFAPTDTVNNIPKEKGGLCSIAGRQGKWTDVSQCSAAHEYLELSKRLLEFVDDLDVLICCEPHYVQQDCEHNVFELTRMVPMDNAEPHVVLKKLCDTPVKSIELRQPQPEPVECRYSTLITDSPFLAEIMNHKNKSLYGYSGVLVSNSFVLVPYECLENTHPTFVRIGVNHQTPLIKVAKKIKYTGELELLFGLLELEIPVVPSENIFPACLPQNAEIECSEYRIIGFSRPLNSLVRGTISPWVYSESYTNHSTRPEFHFRATSSSSPICNLKAGTPLALWSQTASCYATILAMKGPEIEYSDIYFRKIFPYASWIQANIG